ncbi:ribonuclease P protein component [Terrimonas sp. NA20]|uniref:Ribonuclease P protein component n=1 Tax=Terrimonas ginsenosidimutans TaxID=2908004 RepID=A0ABS9KYX5_9BACT|nr:ribonuclease P protein component [Terrimonas ginsenosidimutans]MCG2617594.1 ribonuclease P protein component [Terrimonas ginsenosidimutans]
MKKSLSKKERLKSRKQIDKLFKEGLRLNVPLLRAFYVVRPFSVSERSVRLQFGVGASSRTFKRAVDRNRIKRLGREAWRLQKEPFFLQLEELNKALDVFIIYTGKELPDYQQMYASVAEVIKKIGGKLK